MTDFKQSLETIKSRGYYILNFRPTEYNGVLIDDVKKLKPMVTSAQVSLRGWSFPVIPPYTKEWADIYVSGNKIEAWCTTDYMLETWRYYQSGQFIDIKSIEEDWFKESGFLSGSPRAKVEPSQFFDAINLIYETTEYFIFFANLTRSEQLGSTDTFEIDITLNGIKNRKLTTFDPSRFPLDDYYCRVEELKWHKVVNKEELQENHIAIALEFIMYVYANFNWSTVTTKFIENEQKKLLERRI